MSGLDGAAVFLDRDGTLNERPAEHCYIRSESEFMWIHGAPDAVALLARVGFTLAVVSNQRGLARGQVTENALRAVEARIQADLSQRGCRITAFRYCAHDESDGCSCRKPAPGLLVELARELQLDLSRSWMIGDSDTDVAAGRAAGCRTLLVGRDASESRPDLIAASLFEGARLIASEEREAE